MTSQDTPSPHARLRALAEKAIADQPDVFEQINTARIARAKVAPLLNRAASQFVCAANPKVVLGLLDEIEGLIQDRDDNKDDALRLHREKMDYFDAKVALEAKLREAEALVAAWAELGRAAYQAWENTLTYDGDYAPTADAAIAHCQAMAALVGTSPSAAASALVTRLAELEAELTALKTQPSMTYHNSLVARALQAESALSAARQNARTPGFVEECSHRYMTEDSAARRGSTMRCRGGPGWVKFCKVEDCPHRSPPRPRSEPPHR